MIKDLCFEIINSFSNDCVFSLPYSSNDKTKMVDLNLFKKTIDHLLSDGKIKEISLSGGEPLLHPNIFEMISYCKERNIKVILFTSVVIKKNDIDETYDNYTFSGIDKKDLFLLKEVGLDKIVFKLQEFEVDNYSEEFKNQFNCVADSMLKASLFGLDIDVHFVPLKTNYKKFKEIVEISEMCGVKNISVLNFVPQEKDKELMLTEEEMLEFIKIYKEVKDKFSGVIKVTPSLSKDSHLCSSGLEKVKKHNEARGKTLCKLLFWLNKPTNY